MRFKANAHGKIFSDKLKAVCLGFFFITTQLYLINAVHFLKFHAKLLFARGQNFIKLANQYIFLLLFTGAFEFTSVWFAQISKYAASFKIYW